ncbi:MAG TPA: hypothetical protein VNZ58_04915, partial [Thermomicrobiales bacterium]|nr:hypothetical protein [Thermomicrobiales bacterium]
PLPVDALTEPGYQVLTGGFLDRDLTAHWIASPRNGDIVAVGETLDRSGWVSTYVLDLALLEDRAYATSNILALVQTNVYLFLDQDGAEESMETLADYETTSAAEVVEPVIEGATTVRLVSESGDTYRSVVQQERVVIEVVTLESYGHADIDTHRLIVADTVDRLSNLQHDQPAGIATRAVMIEDGDKVADLFNAQQTGVHQIYRIRDDAVQPAVGEIDPPSVEAIAPGLVDLYQVGQAVRAGDGNGYFSSWIGEFASVADAATFVASLDAAVDETTPGALLPDPFFTAWTGETVARQGITGLYRVSGMSDNGAFSGTLEIRQQGTYVIGIGWRTWGSILPQVDVTSRLMDAQLECLSEPAPCPPVALSDLVPPQAPESATPVAPAGSLDGRVLSPRFGWSLTYDPAVWTVTEQFAENEYDFAELQSGRSMVTIESVVDQRGDPEQCVIDEMHALQTFEEHAVIDLGSDDPDEVPAGLELGHGWAVYTVEPLADERADQEYTIRIDCYTLVEGGASLVMTHRAPRDLWPEERGKGAALRDGLVLAE